MSYYNSAAKMQSTSNKYLQTRVKSVTASVCVFVCSCVRLSITQKPVEVSKNVTWQSCHKFYGE